MAAREQSMQQSTRAPSRPRDAYTDLIGRAIFATLLVLMAYAHLHLWQETGRLTGLGLVLQESVIAVLMITRRRARESMNTPWAWFATIVGSFALFLLRPTEHGLFNTGSLFGSIEFGSALLASFSLLSLGRSFGLVAANRGVRTSGSYRFVRHPVYACYMVTALAYIGENPSLWNVAVFLVHVAGQVARIHTEEAVLSRDPDYQTYQQTVRYRLIPGIY